MTIKSNNEKMGQGVGFERIRRITGYLVGTMDKWMAPAFAPPFLPRAAPTIVPAATIRRPGPLPAAQPWTRRTW